MGKRILVRGARQLITMRGPSRPRRGDELRDIIIIEDGSVLIEDDKILRVGPTRQVENVAAAKTAEQINAVGRVVLPGFVDSYLSPVAAPFKVTGIAGDLTALLHAVSWVRNASPVTLETHARRYAEAAARHGSLTLEAHSGYGLNSAAELKILRTFAKLRESNVSIVPVFCGAMAMPPEFDDPNAYVRWLCEEMIPRLKERKLIRFVDARCDQDAFTPDQLRPYLWEATRSGFPVKLQGDQKARSGCAPLAVECGAISAAGLNNISASDIAWLAHSHTIATLLPASTLSGLPPAPARDLIRAGAAVALATGFNPAISSTYSMQAVIALACATLGMTPEEALTAATVNAAYAVGLGDRCGSLEAGKQADLLILNVPDYHEIPLQFGANLVQTAIRRGDIVWQQGELMKTAAVPRR